MAVGMFVGASIYHLFLESNNKHILVGDVKNNQDTSKNFEENQSSSSYLVINEGSSEEWKIIRELEDELSELKAATEEIKLEKLAKQEKQRERMRRWAARYDVDKRKENASRTIKHVSNELKGYLDLPTDTAKKLQSLLENKAHREVEINDSIRRLDKQASAFERQLAYEHVKSEKAVNQDEFEKEVSQVLDEEQVQKYLELEQSKYQLRHNDTMRSAGNRLVDTFTDLSEYQKSELRRFYDQKEANLDSVKIGTHGVGVGFYTNYFNDRDALSAHLINTLNPEQYQHYLNTMQKRKNKKSK